jgi:hypothetical protein
MINTIEAVITNGQILPLEEFDAPDGTKALVTLLTEDEKTFWTSASEETLADVWDNEEDDVYAELLEK